MKNVKLLLTCLLLEGLLATALNGDCAKPKPVYKVTKLSLTEVGVTCNNGADPTGKKIGELLIISCGK